MTTFLLWSIWGRVNPSSSQNHPLSTLRHFYVSTHLDTQTSLCDPE